MNYELMTRKEIVNLYRNLDTRRKRLMSIRLKLNQSYQILIERFGWDKARKIYDGHESLSGAIFDEYCKVVNQMGVLMSL